MNKLQLMKNDYITKKSLKISRLVPPTLINPPTTNTYNALYSFDLQNVRQHNGLYRMFIKISDIVYTPDQSTPYTFSFENYFVYLLKRLRLRTKRDMTLFECDYRYILKRINENENNYWNSLYDDMTSFSETTTEAYIPLFMFFDQESPLNLRALEALELLVETNNLDNTFDSGFAAPDDWVNLVSCKMELLCMFEDTLEKDQPLNMGDLTIYPPLPKRLLNTYDVFMEPLTTVSGSTEVKIRLECPYPVMAIHALAQGSSMTTFGQITRAKLEAANEIIFDLDSRILQLEQPMAENTFVSHQFTSGQLVDKFGMKKYDTEASGLLDFSNSFYPAYLSLTFASSFSGTVSVFYEMVTDLEVKDSQVNRVATGTFKIR